MLSSAFKPRRTELREDSLDAFGVFTGLVEAWAIRNSYDYRNVPDAAKEVSTTTIGL
jgi:hypothetical protein